MGIDSDSRVPSAQCDFDLQNLFEVPDEAYLMPCLYLELVFAFVFTRERVTSQGYVQ